ncbi:MAG: ATP phosphoribosyltransferase [Deltaproteobacteria bacterium]|nr:ATP phosphoribosyltransferase [Deltaproteobacteria bacterium]
MSDRDETIRLALPKGHLEDGVMALLADANIRVRATSRGYRPSVSLPGFETKILRPQNIVEMLALGSRDVGFTGADWVAEVGADLIELLDCGLDPVRLVAAAPADLLGPDSQLPTRRLVVASEYERLTRKWIESRGLEAAFVRSYGATEVFPPEDADLIVDNTSTGSTLRANKLAIVDELMRSATGLYANPAALEDRSKRERIDELVLVLGAVLEARRRVMVEVNVPEAKLNEVIGALPCMREPTLSPLHGGAGYAVKAAVPREQLPQVIPEIKRRGGTDVVVTNLAQIVP